MLDRIKRSCTTFHHLLKFLMWCEAIWLEVCPFLFKPSSWFSTLNEPKQTIAFKFDDWLLCRTSYGSFTARSSLCQHCTVASMRFHVLVEKLLCVALMCAYCFNCRIVCELGPARRVSCCRNWRYLWKLFLVIRCGLASDWFRRLRLHNDLFLIRLVDKLWLRVCCSFRRTRVGLVDVHLRIFTINSSKHLLLERTHRSSLFRSWLYNLLSGFPIS